MNATKPRYEAGQVNTFCEWCAEAFDPSGTRCPRRSRMRGYSLPHQWIHVTLDPEVARIANEGNLKAFPNRWGGLDLCATSLRLIADDNVIELLCFDGDPARAPLAWKVDFNGAPVPVILAAIAAVVNR